MESTGNSEGAPKEEKKARWAALPEPFHFYRLMLSGDDLHFGYWPSDAPELGLEDAQQRLFEKMCEQLPKPPADILDVGCGLGASAYRLARKGYRVTGIAPSQELIAYARQRYGDPRVRFEAAGFLDEGECDFRRQRYDVLWFQESLQYLHPIDAVFQACRDLLKPEGRIVLCDEIVCGDRPMADRLVHPLRTVLLGMGEAGFRVRHCEQIGDRVRRTCSEMIRRFDTHREMLIHYIGQADTAERIDHYRKGWGSQAEAYETGQMGYAMVAATRDPLFIRTYRPGDEDRILPMFREIFHAERSLEHWRWKFRDNPFGALPIAVSEDETGTLAAHFCGYAVPMASMGGNRLRFVTYQGGDTMTHPAFRGAGIGKDSVLARTARCFYTAFCEGKTPFIYGFNTGVIRKLGERFLGYEYLPQIPFHVLDAEAIACPTSWGKILWHMKGFSVDKVSRITDEYTPFFERVGGHYGILVERNARYLQWRYVECPDGVHHVYALRRWGKLVGWGVFRQRGEVLQWGDALFDPGAIDALGFFLSEVLRLTASDWQKKVVPRDVDPPGKTAPVTRMEAWFSPNPAWWSEALGRAGFAVEREPLNLFPCVKRFDQAFDMETLASKWYYTWGDSDLL